MVSAGVVLRVEAVAGPEVVLAVVVVPVEAASPARRAEPRSLW